jgi:tetratricopeptide (TPR) repeat protein
MNYSKLQSLRKRKISVLRAQGQIEEAINLLNDYLNTFINDNEAWLQLAELYLMLLDYARAAHCFEELLLAQVRAPTACTYLAMCAANEQCLCNTLR